MVAELSPVGNYCAAQQLSYHSSRQHRWPPAPTQLYHWLVGESRHVYPFCCIVFGVDPATFRFETSVSSVGFPFFNDLPGSLASRAFIFCYCCDKDGLVFHHLSSTL